MIGLAYSPSHITGFFEIVNGDSALTSGSRGGGVCMEAGVKTAVHLTKTSPRILVIINGKPSAATVSRLVAEKMLSMGGSNYGIVVEHEVSVPIGAGFGSSGAGALSAAFAINRALGLGLSQEEAAQIAHIAEIECRTGLGTVLAEFSGGAVIRTKPGAPGIGSVSHFDAGDGKTVGAISFGKLSTKDMLAREFFRSAVNKAGSSLLAQFMLNPTADNFLRTSQLFALKLGIVSPAAHALIEEGRKRGILCGVAMLGDTVFSLIDDKSLLKSRKLFEDFASKKSTIIFSAISDKGARLC